MQAAKQNGFTLIELSIVLVIIGLIIGGVLGGKELVRAAQIRKQITQLEQYNVAAAAFRNKYNVLPGDLLPEDSDKFGFADRSGDRGHGDGNGALEPCDTTDLNGTVTYPIGCENLLFWGDLSIAGMLDQDFSGNADIDMPSLAVGAAYNPKAKLPPASIIATSNSSGRNMYAAITFPGVGMSPSFTALDAFSIDSKMDDGLPLSGSAISTIPGGTNPVGYLVRPGQNIYCYDNGAYDTNSEYITFKLCYMGFRMASN